MGPQVDPIAPETSFPSKVDVIVVGGGIIGTSTALALAKNGVSVALCEKGHIAGEQSSRNWGWVRKARRDPREIPLIVESLRLWERMNETVGADGLSHDRHHVCRANASRSRPLRGLARACKALPDRCETDRLRRDREAHPGRSQFWKTALYCPSDGRAEPQKAAPAIAAAARRAGASILTDCAVRGLDPQAGASRPP